MNSIKLGATSWLGFSTANPSTGVRQDADVTPTALVYANGVLVSYLPVVSRLATGSYQVQLDCTTGNGFAAGQDIHVDVEVVVASIAGIATIAQLTVQATQVDDVATLATLIQKLLRNKMVTDPATGTVTIYDDNGAVLMQGQLYEDVVGLQPYRGQGAQRRERMT